LHPEWIVVIGVCTHAGCKPIEGLGKHGGWLCLCHGSDFDTSGRVRSGPALENLAIPPYGFVTPNTLRIGVSTNHR
jgi:ubiquinol-cytochrome c reductase iron-sulfur subunit